MNSVAVLGKRQSPEKIFRIYSLAAAAKMEGVNFFYVSFSNVNFRNKTMIGYQYKNGEWVKKTFPFPDLILNISAAKTDKQQDVYYKLRKMILFTSWGLGSKEYVHRKITEGKVFHKYLPETELTKSKYEVINFIKKHKTIVLKPNEGKQGEGVYFVKLKNNYYMT